MNKLLIDALKGINFGERFLDLVEETRANARPTEFERDDLTNAINAINPNFKYFRTEDFYEYREDVGPLNFYCKFSFTGGSVTIIFGVNNPSIGKATGGPDSRLVKMCMNDDLDRNRLKAVRIDQENIHNVLKRLFSFYEEFREQYIANLQ